MIRTAILKALGSDFAGLDELIRRYPVVESVTRSTFARMPVSHQEWTAWLEECYRVCTHRGCELSGWPLRFLIYYHVGRIMEMW